MSKITSINPATGQVIKEYEALNEGEILQKIETGQFQFERWKKTSIEARKTLMLNLAEVLKKNKNRYAKAIAMEMGKPISQAVGEVEKCAWVCEYYANETESILKNEMVATDDAESYVRFDPLGIVLAVMPWNYPFWQVFRFLAPALMAGNVGLLKHASNVPECSLLIEEATRDAGFPEGCFQSLLIGSNQVEMIIEDDRVKACTLTGSEHAGSQVAMQSGRKIKPTVLELGGSDPFIVLADADVELSCETAATARLQNAGQSCIAAKRFIVEESIYDSFLEQFKAHFESQIVGDPMDEATTMGPLSSEKALEELDSMVQNSVEKGAKIVTGGKALNREGAFYEPTILVNIQKGMPAYAEEFFGPVALVIKVKNAEEAIQVANDTPFGLGASLWTRDLEKAKQLIPQIDAGAVFVNSMVKSDPRLPFGGVKKSGYGRELSHYGMKAFVNVKTVVIK